MGTAAGFSASKGKAKATGSIGAPSSKAPSRKSKASWRKAIDLTDVDEHLESQRLQERLIGPSSTSNSAAGSLFTLDRTGDEQVAKQIQKREKAGKRPLKSLQILQERSAVPPVQARARAGLPASRSSTSSSAAEERLRRAGLTSKAAKDRLRRLAHKKVRDRDVWSGQTGAKKAGKRKASDEGPDDNEWIQVQHNKQQAAVKIPKTLSAHTLPSTGSAADRVSKNPTSHAIVSLSRTLPAVPLPHPGTSYNPDVETHEELLHRAFEVEKAKELDEEARRRFKKRWEELRQIERDDIIADEKEINKSWNGMKLDVSDDDDDDSGESKASADEGAVEASTTAVAAGTEAVEAKKDPKRKTQAKRSRALRAKEEARLALERKRTKHLAHLLTQAPSLRKQLDAMQRARLTASLSRRKAKEEHIAQHGLQGRRIGKSVVPANLEVNKSNVQLGEDLTENLRGLKTEGNLFRDRFQRMQARALVEPRAPVIAKKKLGKRGEKEYERHSYKQFV
ncbi:P60-like protein [Tilletiaria anomala UBC 951]|uniref:Ribosome biogenesis protein NOP53 n=1 Tax=Tilletiaria anomala (strain ATCC 24038 / CBS 436.72 / UBC 951) TaxID=1037660 RepID=A0A066VL05_TILAU|nr:P60-like protein [Tilletiaria anomala UBC 951]KDN42392.1 P60-like protein [Tilletiaria anomala UBC 951]